MASKFKVGDFVRFRPGDLNFPSSFLYQIAHIVGDNVQLHKVGYPWVRTYVTDLVSISKVELTDLEKIIYNVSK